MLLVGKSVSLGLCSLPGIRATFLTPRKIIIPYGSDGEPMARVPKLAREIINTGTRRIPKKRRKMFFITNLRSTLNLSLFKTSFD